MSVQISQPDFLKLVGIVAKIPEFRTVRDRVDLLTMTLRGVPRADDILGQLDLDGNPRIVSVRVVERLITFGRVTPDKEALGVFVNMIIDYGGEGDESDFLRELLDRYALDRPVVKSPVLVADDWKGRDSTSSVQEKIFGENTLRDIRMLQMALKASQAVVRITLPQGTGSGFIVGDNLVMTNHHVLGSQDTADASKFEFGYQIGPDGNPQLPQSRQAKAGGLFHTNVDLDFSVAELESIPEDVQPLLLKATRPQKEARVSIIQHPGGAYKMISMQNNFIAFANDKILQYTTSTMPGSSGSPVFNDDFEVVAIHHSGGLLLEPGTNQKYLRNAGTSMIAVLDDLRLDAADIYARINRG